MKQLLIGNWKMELNEKQSLELAFQMKKRLAKITNIEIAIAPSFVYLKEIKNLLSKSNLQLAGQTVAYAEKGKYTGEVSASTLKEVGCNYVIVGHSERRHKMGETDEMINRKINQVLAQGMIPVLCIGETFEEKKQGQTDSVLVRQLQKALTKVDHLPEKEIVIAYEPVWAIGTGQFMQAEELDSFQRLVKRTIASLYSEKFYQEKVRFLYGGSVNSIIAKDFWISEQVNGLLVGGASLDIEEFYNIALQAE